MALTPQPLMRAQDTVATTYLGPIQPKNWKVHKNRQVPIVDANPNETKPRYNQADYIGGARGDDVTQNTANVAVARGDGGANEPDYPLRTQGAKATALGTVMVQDVGRNRGWIAPSQPYAAPPASPAQNPTVASLSPNTAVAGAATPQFVMKIIGTKFTPYTTVNLAGVPAPSSIYTYVSPTEMRIQMSPASSVAGTASVSVNDHGVTSSPPVNFTWT
jgi:hypothetical protein